MHAVMRAAQTDCWYPVTIRFVKAFAISRKSENRDGLICLHGFNQTVVHPIRSEKVERPRKEGWLWNIRRKSITM